MASLCTKQFNLAFKDEAGRHAHTQLFQLGGGVFRSIQLRNLPLRTLTLGVLIVSGGTLAALPFRRYQALPDASSAPVQVTGPRQSALDDAAKMDAITPETLNPVTRSLAEVDAPPPPHPDPVRVLATTLAPKSVRIEPDRRQVDIPLSFEDLSQPIVPPAPIEQRFNATARVRQKQLTREHAAGLVMPAMESLALSQQEELSRVVESVNQTKTRRVESSLASTQSRESDVQPLPERAAAERQRYWIRQPN